MKNPLGGMRWDGTLDSRPAAIHAAAFCADTPDDKSQVREVAIQLISVPGEQEHHLARALQVVDADLTEIAPLLSQSGLGDALHRSNRWARSSSLPPELGERLSQDSEPRVRGTLATEIKAHPSRLERGGGLLVAGPAGGGEGECGSGVELCGLEVAKPKALPAGLVEVHGGGKFVHGVAPFGVSGAPVGAGVRASG
ncbi:hypothetical protein [Mycobacterium sp. 1245852.3]|uniref:hypothetical protein n=1 Tax=Mycobacterium sp. 1245852.3 TaxID=1856860 RepID=UPI0012E9C3E9|nr:hypothetical protein [Mycobacterium sp. 1245852.3]